MCGMRNADVYDQFTHSEVLLSWLHLEDVSSLYTSRTQTAWWNRMGNTLCFKVTAKRRKSRVRPTMNILVPFSSKAKKSVKATCDGGVLKTGASYCEAYIIGQLMCNSSCSKMYSSVRTSDNHRVAVKMIANTTVEKWACLNGCMVPLEICLLQQVQHVTGVIAMLAYHKMADGYFLVMDRPRTARDLLYHITEKGILEEDIAKDFFYQLLKIVGKIHQAGVFHRDLKLENILVDKAGKITLTDFGCCDYLRNGYYNSGLGSAQYSPPEWMLHHKYHAQSATVWSLGVILYAMVMGCLPFDSAQQMVKFEPRFRDGLSLEMKDLVQLCLCVAKEERPTVNQIFKHPWFKIGNTPIHHC